MLESHRRPAGRGDPLIRLAGRVVTARRPGTQTFQILDRLLDRRSVRGPHLGNHAFITETEQYRHALRGGERQVQTRAAHIHLRVRKRQRLRVHISAVIGAEHFHRVRAGRLNDPPGEHHRHRGARSSR